MSGKTVANRAVKYWNYLPADFDFSSINCFKRNLNKIDFIDFFLLFNSVLYVLSVF